MAIIKIDKQLDNLRFSVIVKDDEAKVVMNLEHIKQFTMPLAPPEVEYVKNIILRVSEGAISFGESEPADLLTEAINQLGLAEEQAALILSLQEQVQLTEKALANANELVTKTGNELDEKNQELDAVRGKLKSDSDEWKAEWQRLNERAVDTNKELDAVRDKLKTTEQSLRTLREDAGQDLVKAEDEITKLKAENVRLNEALKPAPSNKDATT